MEVGMKYEQNRPVYPVSISKQSNCTPTCSQEVSAAGLPWLKHFRVQCYT